MKRRERKSETSTTADITEIEVAPSHSNSTSLIFHVVSDVLAFLLYMHQQIPSTLQDMTLQFDALKTEYKELEMLLTQSELNPPSRRKSIRRKRDVQSEIRRVDKLINTISRLKTAFGLLIRDVPDIEDIVFVFGSSPRRPQYVYHISFPYGRKVPLACEEMTRNKSIDLLSRKVIRTLISKGVGTASYTGPCKLFLLVKAPTSFSMPIHFLPKRDFQYSKKMIPLKLELRYRTSHQEMEANTAFNEENQICGESTWFQCRDVIKGIALGNPLPDD